MLARVACQLESIFGTEFAIVDAAQGELVRAAPGALPPEAALRLAADLQTPDTVGVHFSGDGSPFCVLHLPLKPVLDESLVAVAPFVIRYVASGEDLTAAAERLGISARELSDWISRQEIWTAASLRRLGQVTIKQLAGEAQVSSLRRQIDNLADRLAATHEEISLLYAVTERMANSDSVEDLLSMMMTWLSDMLPARGIAVQLDEESEAQVGGKPDSRILVCGACPLNEDRLRQLFQQCGRLSESEPLVVDGQSAWAGKAQFPSVRQLILVPLNSNRQRFGYIAAVNHEEDTAFSSVQVRLLRSVSTILGIHHDNLRLTHAQSLLLMQKKAAEQRLKALELELDDLTETVSTSSEELSRTYEEITLLHRIAQELDWAMPQNEVYRLALGWLLRLLPLKGAAVWHMTASEDGWREKLPAAGDMFVTQGECPVDKLGLSELCERLGLVRHNRPVVVNGADDAAATDIFPGVHQLIAVPLNNDGEISGWLFGVNHRRGEELGTHEAGVLSSAAAILCLHSGKHAVAKQANQSSNTESIAYCML